MYAEKEEHMLGNYVLQVRQRQIAKWSSGGRERASRRSRSGNPAHGAMAHVIKQR